MDAAGTDDICVTANEDNNPFNDVGGERGGLGGGAGGTWDAFMRTMQGALDGLSMAMGNRNLTHTEQHHLLSDKHKTYTSQYTEVTDRYNYSLDHSSNIVPLEGHKGRHTKAYHDFMVFGLHTLDAIAANNQAIFIEGMYIIGQFVQEHSWLPYARYK